MPDATQRDLFTSLLRELRAAGPIGRLRLLGRGVGALRRLSPWDRKMLLRMAGFEGAESLIERLATEDQETAERLTRVLGDLERDPDRLQETVRALADPERRSGTIDSLLEILDAEPEPPPAEAPEPGPAFRPPSPPPRKPLPEDEPAADAATGAAPPAAAATPPRPAPPLRPAPLPKAAPPPPAPGPETGPEPEPAKAVEPEPEAVAVAPPPPPEPIAPPAPPAPPEPVAPPPSLSLFASPLAARPGHGVMIELVALRRRLSAGENVAPDEIRRLLGDEAFPPWARRRAVSAWIEEARGADADTALALIGELGSPSDRTWCLASLAASRRWPRAAWRKIVAAAPNDAARRRLERRRSA